MKFSPAFIAFFEAAGVAVYIVLFATMVQYAPVWFEFVHLAPMFGIILFLLTFVTSALICGSLILAYPLILFFEGKKRLAIRTVLLSAFWLIVFLAVFGGVSIM